MLYTCQTAINCLLEITFEQYNLITLRILKSFVSKKLKLFNYIHRHTQIHLIILKSKKYFLKTKKKILLHTQSLTVKNPSLI